MSNGIAGNPIAKKDVPQTQGTKVVQAGTKQAWALAADAMLTKKNGMRHDLLGSAIGTKSDKLKVKDILSAGWNINNRSDLLKVLAQLEEHGQREEFLTIKSHIQALTMVQYRAELAELKLKDSKAAEQWKFVQEFRVPLEKKSLIAFDFVRVIHLARWGYLVGYLSEDEAWSHIFKSAKILQDTYSSWSAIGQNYIFGRRFWSGDVGLDGESVQIWQDLISDGTSPWNVNQWNLDLDH